MSTLHRDRAPVQSRQEFRSTEQSPAEKRPAELLGFYRAVRAKSRQLAAPLSDADATVQSMPDASPTKWHLAHTSWFFEKFVLEGHAPDYRAFDPGYSFLFNSYYDALGSRQPRPLRGLITRPTLEEILAYRAHVDAGMEIFWRRPPLARVMDLVELGCHHEQQHQELILTDILHLFAQNPLGPVYRRREKNAVVGSPPPPAGVVNFEGGLVEIGAGPEGFGFDCERPRHRVFIAPFRLADRLVSNAEWMDFIADGGYRRPLLWLSEGWARCCAEEWTAPNYWEKRDTGYWTMTLSGRRPVDPPAPVVHVSYFEADAFARWANRRLPTEAEWELAAAADDFLPPSGNLLESNRLCPAPAQNTQKGLRQMYGDVWEWTSSAFAPYPGFRPAEGAVGEYNGKFMCGQFVLRGGSCVTPGASMRAGVRNFFPPGARWQFSGLRLAGECDDA
jgi:ergothioneine biosynthesis protein EgtB